MKGADGRKETEGEAKAAGVRISFNEDMVVHGACAKNTLFSQNLNNVSNVEVLER